MHLACSTTTATSINTRQTQTFFISKLQMGKTINLHYETTGAFISNRAGLRWDH